jgi:hypothetical protein
LLWNEFPSDPAFPKAFDPKCRPALAEHQVTVSILFPCPEPPFPALSRPLDFGCFNFCSPLSAFCFPPWPLTGCWMFEPPFVQKLRSEPGSVPLPSFPFQLSPLRRIIARLFVMGGTFAQSSVGCRVSLSGHTSPPSHGSTHPTPRPGRRRHD